MNLDDMFATNSSTDAIDNKLDAKQKLEKLGHIDRAILYLYINGYTVDEIGEIIGYSRRHVTRLLDNMSKKS